MLDTGKFNRDIVWWGVVNAICFFATWYFAFIPLPFITVNFYIGLLFVIFCYSVLQSFALRRLITIPHKYLWVLFTALGTLAGFYFGRYPMTEKQSAIFDVNGAFWGYRIGSIDEAIAYGALGLFIGVYTSFSQAYILHQYKGWAKAWIMLNTLGLAIFHFTNMVLINLFLPRSMGFPDQMEIMGASLITIGVSIIYGIFMALFLIRLIRRKPDIDTAVPENG